MIFRKVIASACSAVALLHFTAALAANAPWYPVKVYDASTGSNTVTDYAPLPKADKSYDICALFPHMKDSSWVATLYGAVSEAKRLGVNLRVYEAGGYENLPRQLNQFDDCVASGANAIIIGAISEAGLTQKFAEAKAKGIPVIATINPVKDPNSVSARVFADFKTIASMSGKVIAQSLAGKPTKTAMFPGPAGSGWAENSSDGFKDSIKGSDVTVASETFGDTGVGVQLQLIQDALQSHPDIGLIWGTAPTAEAALGAVAEAGKTGQVQIAAFYENQAMLNALQNGEILGFATQFPVLLGRVPIDVATRILEKKPYMPFIQPIPAMITQAGLKTLDLSEVFAPSDWTPVFTVKQ